MNITKENINELNATITVKIEKNDYEATVNETLKDYRKKVNMPGFRPGKVPAGLVKKMYGKAILADEVNKMLSNNLSKYLVDEKLNILGEPLPNEEKQATIDWDKDEDFEFIFDVAMAPEIEVKLDKRKKFAYYNIEVDDEMVNKQVESYTSRFGENVVSEVAGEKDTLRGDFVQLDAEGNELADGITAEKVIIAIDLMKDEAIRNEAIGKKAGDVLVFDPVKAYESKHEVGHMLNISHEEAEKIEGNFKFTIAEVLTFKAAELNEDLFKKAFGDDTEVKTEEEFRAKLKEELAGQFVQSSDYKFALDSRDALVEKIGMELPEEFLKRWLKATNNELTDEQIDTEFDGFMKDLRWQLIKDRIVRDNEIKIDEADVKEVAKQMAAYQFSQYGMHNVPDEHLENYAGHILGNEEERRRVTQKALDDKVLETIKSKVALEEKAISFDEFNKLLEN
ncbi:trigger factor [Mangrovibacterium marinum]|uniref:Trigger factor n=1 Tax=Mangrovibacterium marinum TaxID=1639118 RepID=A0A2T5BYF5_9BACT|nr:trigger factor [Mangrovibacterium marinum]PTN07264.1 trigger factor [Mangrovibacterium marinum]